MITDNWFKLLIAIIIALSMVIIIGLASISNTGMPVKDHYQIMSDYLACRNVMNCHGDDMQTNYGYVEDEGEWIESCCCYNRTAMKILRCRD